MIKLICKKCKKVIEGYNKNHAKFLMKQHMLKHEREKEQTKLTETNKNNNLL
ncbi:MAG: hypothetical protein ACFFG0_07890 [Candidatus Thorarchaeota archaeon]